MICLTVAVCCDKIDRYPDVGIKPDPEKPEQEKPEEEKPVAGTIIPFTTASLNDEGLSYVWDESDTFYKKCKDAKAYNLEKFQSM